MPKILIICDVYPPSFAPRMGYLVKYMNEFKWSADIVTRRQDKDVSFKSLLGKERVIRVNGFQIPMKTTLDKLQRLLFQKSDHRKNAICISDYVLNNLNKEEYDLILCSTAHRTYILDAAYQVSRSWKMPWIADLRDIHEQNPQLAVPNGLKNKLIHYLTKSYFRFSIGLRNKHLRLADAIITITPWHQKMLSKFNKNVQLIYNGFCPEIFYPKPVKTQKIFAITYMGLIISTQHRDPSLLFQALKKLLDDQIVDERFRIQFYTPKDKRSPIVENSHYQAVSEFVDFYDYVDRSEVPEIMANSSVLLLLTNIQNDQGPKGIMTTKYFEYLGMERPVLCVRSDEDLLEESIKMANAGLSARTLDQTYDFLKELWDQWLRDGGTSIKMNRSYTQQFSRKLQAEQFVKLFKQTLNS